MKAIKYELKMIHKKEIVLAADSRKMIEESLKTMLQAEKDLDVTGEELLGIVVEEKDERDCPGACDGCPYYCPNDIVNITLHIFCTESLSHLLQ